MLLLDYFFVEKYKFSEIINFLIITYEFSFINDTLVSLRFSEELELNE